MKKESNRFKTFLQGLVLTVLAISLFEGGRYFAKKRMLTPAESITTTETNNNIVSIRNADEFFFDDSFKDLQEEIQLVKEEGKSGIFIFFDMQGCPYCQYMKDNVLNQVLVQDFYKQNFRNITLDIHADTEAADIDGVEMTEAQLAAKYGVNLTPTMIFLGEDGNELYRKQGFIKTVEDFMAMGREIVEFVEE